LGGWQNKVGQRPIGLDIAKRQVEGGAADTGGFRLAQEAVTNAATHAELQLLPGIGPSLAEQIIADRERNGPYPSADALDRVPGIGPRTIAQLRAHVRTD